MAKYSIIIPALNEEKRLNETLQNVFSILGDFEVIIADGGSLDNTLEIAGNYFVKIVNCSPGRGNQLSKGAEAARGEIFIFLHADTKLPENALSSIEKHISEDEESVLLFRMRFDNNNPVLKFYSYFTKYESLFSSFGDQCIVVKKEFYNTIGGFSNNKILEDVEFLIRARKLTKIIKADEFVTTSADRFLKYGIIKTQLLNFLYLMTYLLTKNADGAYKKYYMTDNKNSKNALIIFLKYPVPGKVKTRLAADVGNDLAVEVYKIIIKYLMEELHSLSVSGTEIYVFYEEGSTRSQIKKWVDRNFHFLPQIGDDLGEKISNAFETVFNYKHKKVVIIGSDIPDIDKSLVMKSFDQLDQYDAAICPSSDGGYNLLALGEQNNDIFGFIDWSTNKVLQQTISRINDQNKKYCLLTEYIDIDTEVDLLKWFKAGVNKSMIAEIKKIYSAEFYK